MKIDKTHRRVGYGCEREKSRIILDMPWLRNIHPVSSRQMTTGSTTQSIILPEMENALEDGPRCICNGKNVQPVRLVWYPQSMATGQGGQTAGYRALPLVTGAELVRVTEQTTF